MRSPQVRTVHVDPDSDVSEGPRYSIMHTHQTEAHTNIHTDAMESSSNTIGAASPYTVLHRPSFSGPPSQEDRQTTMQHFNMQIWQDTYEHIDAPTLDRKHQI